MENLKMASSEWLLGRSLSETCLVSKELLSDIELWKVELSFFQKLMDQNIVNCDTIDQKKELDHFQKLDNKTKLTEEEYRVEHTELENDLEASIREFGNYIKRDLLFCRKTY